MVKLGYTINVSYICKRKTNRQNFVTLGVAVVHRQQKLLRFGADWDDFQMLEIGNLHLHQQWQ